MERTIVGFWHRPGNWYGMNFISSDGKKSDLPQSKDHKEVKVSPQTFVRRIIVCGTSYDGEIRGIIFFGSDN
jgi:hypothetical protein